MNCKPNAEDVDAAKKVVRWKGLTKSELRGMVDWYQSEVKSRGWSWEV